MIRALLIAFFNLGGGHPDTHTVIDNYGNLLLEMGRTPEEVLASIRAPERFQG